MKHPSILLAGIIVLCLFAGWNGQGSKPMRIVTKVATDGFTCFDDAVRSVREMRTQQEISKRPKVPSSERLLELY